MVVTFPIMFLRIAVTFILAFIFGIERQKSHKPIGFGTFIFVSTGACALAITAINLSSDNPLGLLSAIVTGIGFLGAGALMKTTDRIFGFTSASTIWLFAIFGLVIGVGEYAIGMILYSLIWVVVLYDLNLEKKGRGSYQKRIMISTNKIISEKEIKDILLVSTKLFKLISLEVEKTKKRIIFIYQIEGNKDQINKIPNKLYEKDWFDSCRIE